MVPPPHTAPRIYEAKYFTIPLVACSLTYIKTNWLYFYYFINHATFVRTWTIWRNRNATSRGTLFLTSRDTIIAIRQLFFASEIITRPLGQLKMTQTWSAKNNNLTSRHQLTSIASKFSIPTGYRQCQTNNWTPRVSCFMFVINDLITIALNHDPISRQNFKLFHCRRPIHAHTVRRRIREAVFGELCSET